MVGPAFVRNGARDRHRPALGVGDGGIGVEPEQVQPVLDLVRNACAPPGPNEHRATVFVVDTPHFEQI